MPVPDFLTHYYERGNGPLRSLTELDPQEGEALLDDIRSKGEVFASKRSPDYLAIRRGLEETIREMLIARGGQPKRTHPLYFVLGECEWCKSWYRDPAWLTLPLRALDPLAVSFTYGDSFPALRFKDGRPYRGQVYVLEELDDLIKRYRLPHEWNPDGKLGPERYIEAQVWQDLADQD